MAQRGRRPGHPARGQPFKTVVITAQSKPGDFSTLQACFDALDPGLGCSSRIPFPTFGLLYNSHQNGDEAQHSCKGGGVCVTLSKAPSLPCPTQDTHTHTHTQTPSLCPISLTPVGKCGPDFCTTKDLETRQRTPALGAQFCLVEDC